VPFVWLTPTSWVDWLLLLSLGHWRRRPLLRRPAMTYASANFVAPFNYTQMTFGIVGS